MRRISGAYMDCAKALFNSLPLNNETLTKLSYLSPALQRNNKTKTALASLAKTIPNVLPECELGELDEELRAYTVDETLSEMPVDEEDSKFRLDKDWWIHVMRRKKNGNMKYPALSKLIKAVLTVFTGPLVESSFNIMDDVIEADRTRLTTFNYESLAMIKSSLSAHGQKAVAMTISEEMKQNVCHSYVRYEKLKKQGYSSTTNQPTKSTSGKPAFTAIPPTPKPTQSSHTKSPQKSNQPTTSKSSQNSNQPPPPPSTIPDSSTTPTSATSSDTAVPKGSSRSMKKVHQAPIMGYFTKKAKLA